MQTPCCVIEVRCLFNMAGFINMTADLNNPQNKRKHTSKPATHHFTPSWGNISLSLETVAKWYMLFFRFSSDAVLLFADLQMTAQIVFQVKCKNSTLMYLFAENKQSSRNAATQKKKNRSRMCRWHSEACNCKSAFSRIVFLEKLTDNQSRNTLHAKLS